MNVLSLFDGISCGMIALERAGIKVDSYTAYEIDKNAIKASAENYPQIKHCGNVFDAEYSKEQYDLLIGGSPCTYWSIARSDKAKHKRETVCSGIGWDLFQQYTRALNEVQPKYFLYENNYSISKAIKQEITKCLGVDYVMINSSLFSAQNRKRCYWTNIPIPEIVDKNIDLQDVLERDYDKIKSFKLNRTSSRIKMWNNGKGRENGAMCCDNITHKHKSGTVTSKQDRNYNAGLIEFEDFCRYLTYTEQERLQTLPDGYTSCLNGGARSLAIGNGWTVDVIAHIFSGMLQGETAPKQLSFF